MEARAAILRRRTTRSARNCWACKKSLGRVAAPGEDPLCAKCLREQETCPLCHGGSPNDDVCMPCVRSSLDDKVPPPICEFCRRPPLPGKPTCQRCSAQPINNYFRSEEFSADGIPSGSSIIDTSRSGSTWQGGAVNPLGTGNPQMVTRSV